MNISQSTLRRHFFSRKTLSRYFSASYNSTATTTSNGNNRAEVTKLPNGLRIVSQSSKAPFAAVGILVEAGSAFEGSGEKGATHTLSKFALQSTRDLNHEQLHDEIEKLEGSIQTHESKESLIYSAAVDERNIGAALSLLSQIALQPDIRDEYVDMMKDIIKYEIEQMQAPDAMIDMLHSVAYQKNGYGNVLFGVQDEIDGGILQKLWGKKGMSTEAVEAFWKKRYTADKIIIAGAGISHQKLTDLVSKHFPSLPTNPSPTNENGDQCVHSQYFGGFDMRPKSGDNFFRFGIALQSFDINDPDIFALHVLQTFLGGGSAFSAGGPGKGMYSRLYTSVLNKYHWVESMHSFNQPYATTGLFGIHAACLPSHAKDLVQLISKSLIVSADGLSAADLQRAKNQAKSVLLMALESRIAQVEDLSRSVQTVKKMLTSSELCERIDAVTIDDLKRVRDRLLSSSSKITAAAYGDIADAASVLPSAYKLAQQDLKSNKMT